MSADPTFVTLDVLQSDPERPADFVPTILVRQSGKLISIPLDDNQFALVVRQTGTIAASLLRKEAQP